jgi:hypothetical protein
MKLAESTPDCRVLDVECFQIVSMTMFDFCRKPATIQRALGDDSELAL